jgi:hypothetical protein
MQVRGKVRKCFFKESLLTNNIKLRLISFFKLLNLGPFQKKKKKKFHINEFWFAQKYKVLRLKA